MLTKGQVKKMLTSKAAPPHWFRVGGGWGGGCGGGAWGTQWWAGTAQVWGCIRLIGSSVLFTKLTKLLVRLGSSSLKHLAKPWRPTSRFQK
jgi:hypothetical protein